MQSCLEKRGIEERNIEIVRSDYQADKPYNAMHKDALSDGDVQGKGTGSSGHLHWLPDCTKPTTTINYSNFDTEHGGGSLDVKAREESLVRSMYNKDFQYGANLIDTSANMNQGQYYM